ncbi:MAG TPA: permease-like cell division protein FtsX, partial [Candidatus Deferrimicrobiaceae bacterium]
PGRRRHRVSGHSLLWIDWRLAGKSTARDLLFRFICVSAAAFAFLALLLSGGADRFLASRYAITAVLRTTISPGEGEGLAGKVAGLPSVRSAVYKDPEAAWREFLVAYPGLESLRSSGRNPLPGYIEVRLRPERLTGEDVERVTSILRSVSHVEMVLAGEERLPRLLLARRYARTIAWGVFGAFAAACLAIFVLQEKGRAAALAADFAFLEERGVPAGRMAASRSVAGALAALLLAAACVLLSGSALRHLLMRYPSLEPLVGPPGDLLLPRTVLAAAAFILCFALLAAGASVLGFRAARARRI